MLIRSLFIGFLILSTLASKGVEIQIIRYVDDIPADILLDFFGTMVGVRPAGGEETVSSGGAKKMTAEITEGCRGNADEAHVNPDVAFFAVCAPVVSINTTGLRIPFTPVFISDNDTCYCMSGLSPPQRTC